jgi:hypothetical protein
VLLIDDVGNLVRVHHVGAVGQLYGWELILAAFLVGRDTGGLSTDPLCVHRSPDPAYYLLRFESRLDIWIFNLAL